MIAYICMGLCALTSDAEAAGLRGAERTQERHMKQLLADMAEEDAEGSLSLVQGEVSVQAVQINKVQEGLEAWKNKMVGQMDATHKASDLFLGVIGGVIQAFTSRVGQDVSAENTHIEGDAEKSYGALDKQEARESLAVLEEIEALHADIADLQEKQSLLEEDKEQLKMGLDEIEKNRSMAKEFRQSAKSGLYGAPAPQLEMGSFEELDNDEEAFEEKHAPHPSHRDEFEAKPVHESKLDANSVLHAIEDSLPAFDSADVRRGVLHGAVAEAHNALVQERDMLVKTRSQLEQKLTDTQDATRPLAAEVLAATYQGVSLNMKVVSQSNPQDCKDGEGPGCRSRAWPLKKRR